MNDRFKVTPAVFGLLIKDNNILLLRRANTGWLDGYYDPLAGHLEADESLHEGLLREVKEETGVDANPQDLKLVHIYQNHHAPARSYIGFVFVVSRWKGEPKIKEPQKCDDMKFCDLNNLPKNLTPYIRAALGGIKDSEVTYSFHDEGSLNSLNPATEEF